MTVEEMIIKYAICYDGGDTLAVHADVTEAEILLIRECKPQILQVLKVRQQAIRERNRQAHRVINNIPGVRELRQFRQGAAGRAVNLSYEAFAARYSETELQVANTVLQIEEDRFSPNVAVRAYAQAAFEDLAGGKAPEVVTRRYQREWQKLFDERLQWCK